MGQVVRTEKCRVCEGLKYRLVITDVDEFAFQPDNDPAPKPWYAWVECDPCNGEGFVQVYEYVDNVTVPSTVTPQPWQPNPYIPSVPYVPTNPRPYIGDLPGGYPTICKNDDASS